MCFLRLSICAPLYDYRTALRRPVGGGVVAVLGWIFFALQQTWESVWPRWLVAGIGFALIYVVFRRYFSSRKVQHTKKWDWRQFGYEVLFSVLMLGIANFIGVANLLKGHVIAVTAPGRGEVEISAGGRTAQLPCLLGAGMAAGAQVVLSVRPENVQASHQNDGGSYLEGEVIQAIFLGNNVDCRVRWGEFEWKVMVHPRSGLKTGEKVYLRLDPEHTLAVQP